MHKDQLFHSNLIPTILCSTIALFWYSNAAQPIEVNKCEMHGKLTYTDQPCPADAAELPYTQHVSPPNDPEAAKQRYLADKKMLDQILKQKAQDEKKRQHDVQVYEHQKKLARDHALSCKNLDLNRQRANQQQADAKHTGNAKQMKRSQLRVQQADNNYEKNCQSE
jgi:hypothetical protein